MATFMVRLTCILHTFVEQAQSRNQSPLILEVVTLPQLVFLISFLSHYINSLSKNQSDVLFNQFVQARNANSDDTALTMLVADKLWTFVKSRALRWKMTDFSDLMVSAGDKGKINLGLSIDAKRAFIEGRGKMKNSGPLIAAVIFKGALLGILAFKALFLLSGKALLVSKLSLLLASLIGVKKLLSGKGKHVTYEIVNDNHRFDTVKPQAPGGFAQTQTTGWQRALDLTVDSFIENFANKFN